MNDAPFTKLSQPAQRALANARILTLIDLTSWQEKDVKALHGMGLSPIKLLKEDLRINNLDFKK